MDSTAIEGLKAEAATMVAETVDKFFAVTTELSRRDDDHAAWGAQFVREVSHKCAELLSDIENLRRDVAEKVDAAALTVEGLCAKLHLEAPKVDADKCLYEKLAQLEEWITGYKEQVNARMSEINVLIEREEALCSSLGRRPKSIETDPLPFQAHIDEFKEHIKQLETEKALRSYRKKEIDDMVLTLGYSPRTDFEERACRKCYTPIDEEMDEFVDFYDALKKKLSALKEDIRRLRSEISDLWDLLCVDPLEQKRVKKNTEGCNSETLKVLKAEKERCTALKMANIERFITALRNDLKEIWKKCHCPETVREEFEVFDTDWFNETLLQIHETELKRWKQFYEENKELLKLIEKHSELWRNMLKLEENAANPDRFKNRGGQLLKEEKERKALSKRIPQIEEEMRQLSKEFKSRTGREFTTYGFTVEEHISNLHADRENLRVQKLSSRKKQVTPAELQGNCVSKLTPACKRKLVTPGKAPVAEKMAKSAVHENI